MRILGETRAPVVQTEVYSLVCADDRPYVYLRNTLGELIAELFVLSSVHSLNGRDDTVRVGSWEVTEGRGEIVLQLTMESSLWTRKICRFRCAPERFSYELE